MQRAGALKGMLARACRVSSERGHGGNGRRCLSSVAGRPARARGLRGKRALAFPLVPPLAAFLLLYAAMYAAFGLASPFTPALLHERGLNVTSVGLFLGVGTAIRAVSAPLAGRVADGFAALRPTLSICAALAGFATLLLLLPRAPLLILGILFVYSVTLAP